MSATKAASWAVLRGRRIPSLPSLRARMARDRPPRIGQVRPDRLSSPAMRNRSMMSVRNWLVAERMPRAMGRSKIGPSFRRCPGARLIVVRVRGMSKPLLARAEVTRSCDSLTAASGRPTSTSFGSPTSPVLTSTWTGSPSIPESAPD